VIDTDSDPDTVDIPIPGNDDAMRAIELICRELGEAVQLGKAGRTDKGEEEKAAGPGPRARRERVAPLTAPSPAPAPAQPAPPAEPAPAPRPPPQA
jgi:small subunit ribosomal protein S2